MTMDKARSPMKKGDGRYACSDQDADLAGRDDRTAPWITEESNMPPALKSRRTTGKQVRFSENSVLYVFPKVNYVKRNLTCTQDDRAAYKQNTIAEAVRLRRLLSNTSNGAYRLSCLPKEEVVAGLEALILEGPMDTVERREAHRRVILMEQENQKVSQGAVDDVKLARMSMLLTRRCASQARARAA